MSWQQGIANISPELLQTAKAQRRQRRVHPIPRIKTRLRCVPAQTSVLPWRPRPTRDAIRPQSGSRRRPRHTQNRCLHDLVHSEAESRDALCSSEAIHRCADDATSRTQRRIRTVPARSNGTKPQKTCKTGSANTTNRLSGPAQLFWASPIGGSNPDFFNTIRTKLSLDLNRFRLIVQVFATTSDALR